MGLDTTFYKYKKKDYTKQQQLQAKVLELSELMDLEYERVFPTKSKFTELVDSLEYYGYFDVSKEGIEIKLDENYLLPATAKELKKLNSVVRKIQKIIDTSDTTKLVKLYLEISDVQKELYNIPREEIQYFRKYSEQLDYLVDTYGLENCEDLVMTKGMLSDLRNKGLLGFDLNYEAGHTYVVNAWW